MLLLSLPIRHWWLYFLSCSTFLLSLFDSERQVVGRIFSSDSIHVDKWSIRPTPPRWPDAHWYEWNWHIWTLFSIHDRSRVIECNEPDSKSNPCPLISYSGPLHITPSTYHAYSSWYTQLLTHLGNDHSQRCLSSVIWEEPVFRRDMALHNLTIIFLMNHGNLYTSEITKRMHKIYLNK